MRLILAIFLAVLLLAPSLRWATMSAPLESCACPPAACSCEGHLHTTGHAPMCAMANGGKCGIESRDAQLATLYSQLVYVPVELPGELSLAAVPFHRVDSRSLQLFGYFRAPEPPPRLKR
jgi:hypothetical protein